MGGAKRPRLSLWESWQPERADLSARRRYASEQPPQAALSESQRGCRAYFGTSCVYRSAPPQLRVRSAAFNSGMIATGNHNFEKFAALCNTPVGAPRALRAGCICVLFYLGTVSSALSYVRFLSGIVTGRVREPTYGYRVRSGIKKHPSRLCTR